MYEFQIGFWDILPLFSANRKASGQESRGMQYWLEVRHMWTRSGCHSSDWNKRPGGSDVLHKIHCGSFCFHHAGVLMSPFSLESDAEFMKNVPNYLLMIPSPHFLCFPFLQHLLSRIWIFWIFPEILCFLHYFCTILYCLTFGEVFSAPPCDSLYFFISTHI